jgi:hypothetical protein
MPLMGQIIIPDLRAGKNHDEAMRVEAGSEYELVPGSRACSAPLHKP